MFTEENTFTIDGYSEYPYNDMLLTVGNSTRQIDNYATFHDTTDVEKGGANMVFVDGHAGIRPRAMTDEELDEGFRLVWPKKEIPR